MSKTPENLYRPERLDGEGFKTYRHRLWVAKLGAKMTVRVESPGPSKGKSARRKLVDALGVRQAKKLIRAARALHAESLANTSVRDLT